MQAVSVAVWMLKRPPPALSAELPLTVQSVSVSMAPLALSPPLYTPAPPFPAELPLIVQSVSFVFVPLLRSPAAGPRAIATDRATAECRRAAVDC